MMITMSWFALTRLPHKTLHVIFAEHKVASVD